MMEIRLTQPTDSRKLILKQNQIRRREQDDTLGLIYREGFSSALMSLQVSEGGEIMDDKIRSAIFRQVETEPFAKKFGLKLVRLEDGYSKVEMHFTPDMENIFGLAHGGALFALIDEAFETASNSHGTMAVALNMNITYVSSPSPGSRLFAEAREFSRTHRTANYDIRVTDGQDNLIASCQALVYRKGTPLPFLEPPAP
jgi:acyl-CoA thioesterase